MVYIFLSTLSVKTCWKHCKHLRAALVFFKQSKMIMVLIKTWDSYWRGVYCYCFLSCWLLLQSMTNCYASSSVLLWNECISLDENTCPPPPQLPNAKKIPIGRNYKNGSKIAFSCLEGFHLIGASEITCINGKWQSPPYCVGQ